MDSYRLSLGGTTVDLGSYVLSDPGPDFDPGAVLKAQFAENPYADGGQFVLEDSSTRTFKFPIRVPSSSAFTGGMDGLEQLIRNLARPGAFIDLQPEGTATANAVRFDILAGRVDLKDYSIFKQRVMRRDLDVELSVTPYGYMPTLIVLASAASIGLPGALTVPGASVLGDVPALAEIVISPTSPTSYPLGTWALDTLGWSLAGRPSFQSFWPAASLVNSVGSLIGDAFAPGSQALGIFPSPTMAMWNILAVLNIPAALEPAYRGRFRAFAFAKLPNYSGVGWQVALDAAPQANTGAALATGGQVATLAPELRGVVSFTAAASPAYTLLDLGDITLPLAGSGGAQPMQLRFWTDVGGTYIGIASPQLRIGGVYLLPEDGAAGILPRGLAQPTIAPVGSVGRLALSALTGEARIDAPTANLSSYNPMMGGGLYYRGPLPRLGASNVALQLLGANRRMGAHSALLDEAQSYSLLSYYRMADPAGASAIAPFPGYGPTGIATNSGPGGAGGLWGGPSQAGMRFTGNTDSWGVASGVGMPSALSVFVLVKRSSAISSAMLMVAGGSIPQGWGLFYDSNYLKGVYGGAVTTGLPYSVPDASYHSIGFTIDGGGSPITKLYYDASLIGTHQGGSWNGATAALYFAAQRGFGGTLPFPGFMSEVMVFGQELTGSQVARLHQAAFSPTGGATTPMVRASEAFAAVSVSYRPRFAFLRAI